MSLVRSLGSSSDQTLAKRVTSADYILLFDPLPLSRLWSQRRKCWNDKLLIIDATFLLAFHLLTLFRGVVRTGTASLQAAWQCCSTLKSRPRLAVKRLGKAVFAAFVTDTYAEILRGPSWIEAVFLTCNSTLTELLRTYLIQCKRCPRIYEVMHGIGSIPAERFFSTVLSEGRAFGAYERHFFVPQIPKLPLYGAFQTQARFRSDAAINAYLNHYLLEQRTPARPLDAFVAAECASIVGTQRLPQEPLVVTIFGNRAQESDVFESASFRAECLLITLVVQSKKDMEREWIVIYVPHPAYSARQFVHPALSHNGVMVYENSVFAWLISDLCISLLSSAVFEAVYFGAKGFTPLVAADSFFTQAYLDLLVHPESESLDDFLEAFRRFLSSHAAIPRRSLLSKARMRLGIMGYDGLERDEAVRAEDGRGLRVV